jgi:hypothetical protein
MDQLIEQRLAVIETVVVRLEERLFGNGQPGEIAQLKRRVRNLESWFWRAAGAGGVLLALLQLLDHSFARLAGK